jgi:UDPglucose 6-dehydrogenase
MLSKSKKIGVVGLWHLGSVLCAAWSKLGYEIKGFDYDKQRVTGLLKGIPPVFEPDLSETIRTYVRDGILSFSSNMRSLSKCDFIFLSYDTPVTDDDSSDLTILEKSVKDLRTVMKDDSILIVSSQSPVGYCSTLRTILRNENKTLDLVYSPENLRLGEAIECYLNPDRIILGTSNRGAESKCLSLLSNITDKILTMNIASSEMVKHGINSFLAMSIVFTNSLADLCEETGANIDDVVEGLKSDPRIGQKAYLSPGVGFSGGTLGRDLKVLDEVHQRDNNSSGWFGDIHKYNISRKYTMVNKIAKLTNGLERKTLGVLGLTYKPGTSTLRRSLPLEIVNLLIDKGATVRIYDPKADYSELKNNQMFMIETTIEDLSIDADMLVLLTEWPAFKEFDWSTIKNRMKTPAIFDTKNFLNREELKESGFTYYSIGMI